MRRLAAALRAQGPQVSPQVVGDLRHDADDRVHGARTTRAGGTPPDRHAPFAPIAARVRDVQQRPQPVLAVEATQQARLGDGKTVGRAWHPTGQPPPGRVSDVIDPTRGKAMPAGVDDVHANLGWVSVGVDQDTPALAVATIRAWWLPMGSPRYPTARARLITADSGGRHSTRARRWTRERQRCSDARARRVCVSHLPPGTRQWHTIAPRLGCHITANWRGQPLERLAVVVRRSGDPNPAAGLRIQAALDAGHDPQGITVRAVEMQTLPLDSAQFHGEWT